MSYQASGLWTTPLLTPDNGHGHDPEQAQRRGLSLQASLVTARAGEAETSPATALSPVPSLLTDGAVQRTDRNDNEAPSA